MNQKGSGLPELFGLIVVYLLLWIPIAFWTDSNLDFWMSFIKKEPVNVPFILSYIVSIVCNAFILAANVIMSIFRLVV